jgi:hypothetical protein
MKLKLLLFFIFVFLVSVSSLQAQVLGSCASPTGSDSAEKPAPEESVMMTNTMPLPGDPAIDFELTAVVGDDIKNIKLSDYQGKWRLVCFFPAAFTFV